MIYADIVKSALALIDGTGLDSRANALSSAVKSRLLRFRPWEHLLKSGTITYTAGSESISLDTAAYREIYRILAIRIQDELISPPEFVTQMEWSRQLAIGGTLYSTVEVWTQFGKNFATLAQLNKTYKVIYMRDPSQVGWGDISEEFFDAAVLILSRMLTPASVKMPDGQLVRNPARDALLIEEEAALRELAQVENRQPGRRLKVARDDVFEMRVNEDY